MSAERGTKVQVDDQAPGRSGRFQQVRQLPDALIDQIAAGEVVERPASVVKELVENALDAGATRISVEVRDGGSSLIAVTDNGTGIAPGDVLLALSRHATSKLSSAEGLLAISSFGFRGEALPAIASVSRLRLRTRLHDAAEGRELRVEAGVVVADHAAGGPGGTRIEVADLFGAVPARRKFLKKPATEWGHIADWLSRLALALPGVHFEAQRDGKSAFVWPATADPMSRISSVLTERVARQLVPVSWESSTGHIEAFLSGPEHTRSNANGLYLFANGRPVRDAVMRHALVDAYRDLLPRGRFPTGVLMLTVPPESLDVNVHPAKWEVRFSDPRAIHSMVRSCVRQAMSERGWLSPGPASGEEAGGDRTAGAEHDAAYGRSQPGALHGAPMRVADRGTVGSADKPETTDWVFAAHAAAGTEAPARATEAAPADASATVREPLQFGGLRVVGQLLASYIIVETKSGMVLVDQHAAHERVLYEQLRAEWLEHHVAAQPLLVPENVEIDRLDLAALVGSGDLPDRMGFDLEPFGETAVMVRAIPALLAGKDPATLVRGLAQDLGAEPIVGGGGADAAEADPSDVRRLRAADRAFATLACHSARRFGDHLEPAEQQAILRGLDGIPWAPTCPHGRPVAIPLGVAEIERRFGRR